MAGTPNFMGPGETSPFPVDGPVRCWRIRTPTVCLHRHTGQPQLPALAVVRPTVTSLSRDSRLSQSRDVIDDSASSSCHQTTTL